MYSENERITVQNIFPSPFTARTRNEIG